MAPCSAPQLSPRHTRLRANVPPWSPLCPNEAYAGCPPRTRRCIRPLRLSGLPARIVTLSSQVSRPSPAAQDDGLRARVSSREGQREQEKADREGERQRQADKLRPEVEQRLAEFKRQHQQDVFSCIFWDSVFSKVHINVAIILLFRLSLTSPRLANFVHLPDHFGR